MEVTEAWGQKNGGERALEETAAVYRHYSDARHSRQRSRRLCSSSRTFFLADLEFRRFPWDLTRKRDETRDEKTEEPTNDVKAAAAKTVSGEGVEPTYNMTEMIEFATRWQEERDTTHAPIQIKGRAAKIKFHD